MRSKSEQDVYLKFLACAYCACEHFSQLFSWAVLLLQINLFSIMCMIYCILIHFLCLKESLIFFCTLIKILSRVEWFYQTQHSTKGRSSWNFSQSIYETDFDRVFCRGKIESTLNTFSLAAWCWLKIIIISSRERRNIWLQIITIIKGIKDVLSGLADKWLKWFLFPSLCTLKNSVKKKNCLKLSHYPSNCVCFSP